MPERTGRLLKQAQKFTQEIKDFVAYWKANDKKCPVFIKGASGYDGWVPVEVSYDSSSDSFVLIPLVNATKLGMFLSNGTTYYYDSFILKCKSEIYYKSESSINYSGGSK